MWKHIVLVLMVLLSAGCKPTPSYGKGEPVTSVRPSADLGHPGAFDMSFLDRLDGTCDVEPSATVALVPAEQCWIDMLAAECSPANDCLVKCLASGEARTIGGGCWHVCFTDASDYARWREPTGGFRCRWLERKMRAPDRS
jgi:hypothetical protein